MRTKQIVEQRKRKIEYSIATEDQAGLELLVSLVGAEALVRRYQEFYIARNPLLSTLDRIDKGEYKGEEVYPEQGSDEVIFYDLLANLPKPGERRTKWGDLKVYVDQAKSLLDANGEKDASEDRVRQVAERLKAAAEKAKDELLG